MAPTHQWSIDKLKWIEIYEILFWNHRLGCPTFHELDLKLCYILKKHWADIFRVVSHRGDENVQQFFSFSFHFIFPLCTVSFKKNRLWINRGTEAQTFFLSITLRLRTTAQVVMACHQHQFCYYYSCSIDLIPKWRPINYSFVCMSIIPLRLIFHFKILLFSIHVDEAKRAN